MSESALYKIESLLTAEQVAKLLNLRVSTIYDAATKGRIPCIRLWRGQRRAVVRFLPEDIANLIRSRRTPAEPFTVG
jgi:excisionase family DNA binding protein